MGTGCFRCLGGGRLLVGRRIGHPDDLRSSSGRFKALAEHQTRITDDEVQALMGNEVPQS